MDLSNRIYTANNHFKYGYDGKLNYAFRQSPSEQWGVEYGHSTRTPGNFRDECIATAKLIRDIISGELDVFMSGGIDSEVIAESFRAASIPFRAVTLRFNNNLNRHDIRWAIDYCNAHGVPHDIIDINVYDYFRSLAYDYAEQSQCVSPIMLTTMWLMDQVDGYPILGSGDLNLVKNSPIDPNDESIPKFVRSYLLFDRIDPNHVYDGKWYHKESERMAAWYRHLMIQGRQGCPGFYQFTPELAYAFLADPVVKAMVASGSKKISIMDVKKVVFAQYFSLPDRPKYNGLEQIMDIDGHVRRDLMAMFPNANQFDDTPYEDRLASVAPKEL